MLPLKSNHHAARALSHVFKEVADPEGISYGIMCDGGAEFKYRSEQLATDPGIKITTNAPYNPRSNLISERGFGMIGIVRSLC